MSSINSDGMLLSTTKFCTYYFKVLYFSNSVSATYISYILVANIVPFTPLNVFVNFNYQLLYGCNAT